MGVFDTETVLLNGISAGRPRLIHSGSLAASLAIRPAANLFGMADDWLHCAVTRETAADQSQAFCVITD